MIRRSLIAALVLLPLTLSAQQDFLSSTGPAGLANVEQRLGSRIRPNIEFLDERGQTVQLGDYFGDKPVIITPVYYSCPMLCNLVLDGLVRSLREIRLELGRDYEVVTYSFDPRDTVKNAAEKKSIYAPRLGRGDQDAWHFLTGNQESINALSHALGFEYTWDPKRREFAHAALVVLVTPEGKISRYFYGISHEPRDFRLGLVETASERIGSITDHVLLLCYGYDPSTGKYTPVALNIVRVGGAATALAIGGFIFVMIRRERRGEIRQEPDSE